jgi:hypothetical protein
VVFLSCVSFRVSNVIYALEERLLFDCVSKLKMIIVDWGILLQADPLISNLYFQVPIQNKSDEQPKLQVSKRYETVILY